MIEAKTISSAPPSDPILDWSGLVDEGRATLEAMSDGEWTDFNAHDPGITILELIAFALTDLGYRAGHPVADLVAGSTPLLGPADSLTTSAVSLEDMRRLGLDVAGAKNVWIEPASVAGIRLRHSPGPSEISFDEGPVSDTQEVALAGVHRVVIEKSSREDLASADLARNVALRLHAERNLGEDFDSFAVLEPKGIAIVADVEIEDAASAESILLAIFSRLDACLSPRSQRTSVAELRRANLASDTIYDGPMFERGIPAPPDPGPRRRIIHLSDIIAELASTPGVRATRRVRLGTSLEEANEGPVSWSLEVEPDRVPAFDLQSSEIRLLVGGAVALDSSLRPDLARGFADTLRAHQSGPAAMQDEPLPAGRDRGVDDYRPLRLDLPTAYGVRPGFLARDATPARRAAANQLRAYLAILDALLANFFAQLAGAKSLLAASPNDGRSYFTQPAEGPSGEAPLFSQRLTSDALQNLVEESGGAAATARRDRFLAHLLARFGEDVPAIPQPVGVGFEGDATPPETLRLRVQEAFLAAFPRLSAGRGSGANLLVDGEDSPLLDRILLKLGLPPSAPGRLLLVEHILLRGLPDDEAAALPLLAKAARPDPYSLQISFVLDARLKVASEVIARVIREECPAHLVAYVHWLPRAEFDAFAEAHGRWMKTLRLHRREQLGFPPS